MDAVRIGSALLGRVLNGTGIGLQRTGWAEASVDELHQLKKGESTGYGAGWVAKRDTTLAILPIGYFHGFGAEYGRDLLRLRDGIRTAISSVLSKMVVPLRDCRFWVNTHRCFESVIDISFKTTTLPSSFASDVAIALSGNDV